MVVVTWLRRRRRMMSEADRARAEALVQVEARGMMGGKAPELRIQSIPRRPRLRPAAPLAIEHEDGS